MVVWSGQQLGKELCEALKLDPTNVVGITLHCVPQSAAVVTITRIVTREEATAIREITERYQLERKPAEETLGLGSKGIRDPLAPCERFDPTQRQLGDFADCETDGHYLCSRCRFRKEG